MVKKWASERAEGHGMKYAEIFRVITLESDENWEVLRKTQNGSGD